MASRAGRPVSSTLRPILPPVSPSRERAARPCVGVLLAPVQDLVDKLVGALVVLARDAAHRPVLELPQGVHGLEVQRLHVLVLDLVLAADLARHELRVVDHLDLPRAELVGQLEAEEDRPVLGYVVGRLADVAAALYELVALGGGHHRAGGGRAGVAARAAVHVDDDLVQAAGAQRCEGGSIGGKLPLGRWRRRSLNDGWLPGVPPCARRSTITSTLGSSR